MLFAARNAIGVPWSDPAHERRIMPYLNTGSARFQYVMDPAGVRMCSVMAPGQSGFINPKGEADTHHSDQLEMYAAFKCKSDAISAQDIDKSSQGSQTLRY
jgi:penicillin amidase